MSVSVRPLDSKDLEPLIKKAKECLEQKSQKNNNYDWKFYLNAAYYALGGDYGDEEAAYNALSYAEGRLAKLKDLIPKLSHEELELCIREMRVLLKK
jgi:hypothetical protein